LIDTTVSKKSGESTVKNAHSIHDKWTMQKAIDLYGIQNWGNNYFFVSEKGEVNVRPDGVSNGPSASLMEIVSGLKERGMEMPMLLRFEDILASRIKVLNESFRAAIREYGYKGTYRGVYPIKVNQQQQVLEELTSYGRQYHHGLEAGSKAELIAAMSYLDDPEALLVCNGYKDEEFIDLGLHARKMGMQCVFVVETMTEVPLIIRRSKQLGIKPILGVRMKLSACAGGHWKESGGDRSVFGLNTAQIVAMVDLLKEAGLLDCLRLLHYHLGSQIPNIRDVRMAIVEACRIYGGLIEEGAPMGMIDLGGGLAVDYDGSHTNFASSCNYSIDEYCRDVVEVIQTTLNENDVPHPTIVTESGRATVAYYSVLLFNILDISRFSTLKDLPKPSEDSHDITRHLHDAATQLTEKNLQESFHDAIYYRDEIRELFKHGKVSIRERAMVEEIFWQIMHKINRKIPTLRYVPDDFEGMQAALADTYYGNLSVFQSLPDVWAINQLFPIMPIHRLNEEPTRQAVIADITCDCDGKIDRFIDMQDVKTTLLLHDVDLEKDDYYLGVFVIGAYQETLGDLHNLLGDTNVASIRLGSDGEIEYVRQIDGDSVADVLTYVEYDPSELINRFRQKAERAVQNKLITVRERRQVVELFNSGLQGYTYFETSPKD
jgi:arginine decarboxylase